MESKAFVSWDEVVISNEKAKREVHYYLRRSDGGSDLAVVGKEKSPRHMAYVVPNLFLRSLRPSSSLKWRTRREVIDWLSSLVADSHSSKLVDRILDDGDTFAVGDPAFKDFSSRQLKHQSKEFSWIGSSWMCRKKRKHYQSFSRNGITISVFDFVHVMAEENKRLVAYLEDMYEDSRANNMVVVRWFHKLDEVGIVLPPNCNDREIFFSLCLQDLNVECIDGFATVLSAHHFEKYLNEATHTTWVPYLCHRQFDNDDIKPFDVSKIQGYWRQELLGYMYTSERTNELKCSSADGLYSERDGHADVIRSRLKRKHVMKDVDKDTIGKETTIIVGNNGSSAGSNAEGLPSSSVAGGSGTITTTGLPRKLVIKRKPQQYLSAGCSVEVLSQDSGIRGCWFRCLILKRHGDKLKVRYQDVRDADETGYLEEWILASRVVASDKLGLRMCGRTAIRPHPLPKGRVSKVFDVGTAVDAWWHDGWWEGIVVRRESEDKFQVYFPGDQRTSAFGSGDLRRSLDWVCNRWNHIKDRPDVVNSILSEQGLKSADGAIQSHVGASTQDKVESLADEFLSISMIKPCSEPLVGRTTNLEVPDLAQDNSLANLKWSSSRKRRRSRERLVKGGLDCKRRCDGSSSSSQDEDEPSACNSFVIPKSLKVDHENCKYGGNPLFPGALPTLSSLVMSQ
ncbi:hypothetical protein AAC387_Pa01g1537 [Persea americana]